MVIVFAFVLITLSTFMYARVIVNLTTRLYSERTQNLAGTAAEFVDAEAAAALRVEVEAIYDTVEPKVFSDRWNEYVAAFAAIEQSEEFVSLRETLRKLQDLNRVSCVYLVFVDPVNEAVVYMVDSAYEDACPPGCIDPVYEMNREVLTNPERGFPAYETDTEEYGSLISAGVPVRYNGRVIAYTFVDNTIEALRHEQARNIWKLYGYLVAVAILICIIAMYVIKVILVTPIKALSDASHRFAENQSGAEGGVFANLDIRTHDELEELAESMKNMETQIVGSIRELTETNKRLIASQNLVSEMSELANKDALTGVRNKLAYERFIEKMNERIRREAELQFGVAMFDLDSLKQINDSLGHASGDNAIVTLSKVICNLFAHSPVFRIGGDEFVAILENADYQRASELVGEFRLRMEQIASDASLGAEARITAASGFSAFDRGTDSCYADVFKRADSDMYRNKSAMKATSHHTP